MITYEDAPREWGRWGPDDEIGRVNLLSPEAVVQAAGCIRSGKRFSLALPVGHPMGDPTFPGRVPPRVRLTDDAGTYEEGDSDPVAGGACFAQDVLEVHCHGTTHLDALGHSWADGQLWNGYPASTTAGGLDRAAVGPLAQRGVVGRAVLVDVARAEGVDWLEHNRQVTVADLSGALERQGTELRRGDVLVVRTGSLARFYVEGADAYSALDEPGVTYEPELLDLLTEHDVVGLGSDTLCNEKAHSDLLDADFPLHVLLQRNLGITFHEALWLEDWSADCAADGVWDAFYVAAPLRLVRGSGAPMNPIVIK